MIGVACSSNERQSPPATQQDAAASDGGPDAGVEASDAGSVDGLDAGTGSFLTATGSIEGKPVSLSCNLDVPPAVLDFGLVLRATCATGDTGHFATIRLNGTNAGLLSPLCADKRGAGETEIIFGTVISADPLFGERRVRDRFALCKEMAIQLNESTSAPRITGSFSARWEDGWSVSGTIAFARKTPH